MFAGTWCFNKRVEISYLVERMVLHGESKLEKNETNDADQKHITAKRITLSQSSGFLGNQSKFTS